MLKGSEPPRLKKTREHREDHARTRDDVRSAVEGVDQKLQEEITRVAEDASAESVVETMTGMLQQDLAEQDRKYDRMLVSMQSPSRSTPGVTG